MDFRDYYFALEKKIGLGAPTKESVAKGLSVSMHEVTAMLRGDCIATAAQVVAMGEILARPPYPGYVVVSTMAKFRKCSRNNIHQLIKSGAIAKPGWLNGLALKWSGDEYKHIWEGAYHDENAP